MRDKFGGSATFTRMTTCDRALQPINGRAYVGRKQNRARGSRLRGRWLLAGIGFRLSYSGHRVADFFSLDLILQVGKVSPMIDRCILPSAQDRQPSTAIRLTGNTQDRLVKLGVGVMK
jgi:hypothetical protein